MVRLTRQHRIQIRECQTGIALGDVDRGARAIRPGACRAENDGVVKIGERMVVIGFRQIDLPAFAIGQCVLGVALDRAVEIGQRAVILFLAVEGRAAQRKGGRVAGIELEGGVGIMQHAVGVAVLQPQRAAQIQEVGLRGEFDRAADVGHRTLAVAFLIISVRPQGISRGARLIGGDGAVVDRDGLVEIVLHRPDYGLRGIGADILRIEPLRFRVIGERAVKIAAILPRACTQHVIRRARLDLQGVVEVGERADVIALAQIELAAAAIEAGAVGAEADRLLIILQRAVDIAEVAPHGGAVDVRRWRIGIELDGGVVVGERLAVVAARIPGIAAILIGGRKIGRE